MPSTESSESSEPAASEVIRDHFLGWQCRVRQLAVRRDGGRPSRGMRPRVEVASDEGIASSLVVLIVERDPGETTTRLRHICHQTHDPRSRYRRALELLSSAYFQYPRNFSEVMTASFGPDSTTAACLNRLGECVLHFEQFGQYYRIPCSVWKLGEDDPAFQATYWHNNAFNPYLPGRPEVLAFRPLWERAHAQPPAV